MCTIKQGSGSSVNAQCTRSDNSMEAVELPWERHESAGNRQLENLRDTMELHSNAKVAVRLPWKRRENAVTSSSSG